VICHSVFLRDAAGPFKTLPSVRAPPMLSVVFLQGSGGPMLSVAFLQGSGGPSLTRRIPVLIDRRYVDSLLLHCSILLLLL
jgi:hypothetical protein